MKVLVVAILIFAAMSLMCTKSTEPDNTAPSEPGTPTPANGAADQPLIVVLSWTGGDPDGDPLRFDVYFGVNSSPPLVSSDQAGRNYAPDTLDYNTQYYWRVVAKDDHDHETEGAPWSFTTGNTPLPPVNISIQSDSEGDGVIIGWDKTANIDSLLLVLPDSTVVALNADDTTYADDAPAQTGMYTLYAVHGGNLSSPATATSAPFASTSDVLLYRTQDGPGGYGWYVESGEGEAYYLDGANTSMVDFYFAEDTLTLMWYLRSGDQPPYNGDKSTDILDMGTTSFFTAPLGGYGSEELVVVGDYYAMHVEGDYYAKVYVVSTDSLTMTFRYWFQILQSLRIF
jgi:hypothetical protein